MDILEEAGYTLDDVTDCTWADWIKIGEDVYNKTGKYLLSMDGEGNDLPYMMLQAEGASQWKDGEPYITEIRRTRCIWQTTGLTIQIRRSRATWSQAL